MRCSNVWLRSLCLKLGVVQPVRETGPNGWNAARADIANFENAWVSFASSGVQVEHFVHDLPFPVYLQQREQIGKPMPDPVINFQPRHGNRTAGFDAGNPSLYVLRRTILVVPIKESL